jgi:hypothetical protein
VHQPGLQVQCANVLAIVVLDNSHWFAMLRLGLLMRLTCLDKTPITLQCIQMTSKFSEAEHVLWANATGIAQLAVQLTTYSPLSTPAAAAICISGLGQAS